MGSSYKEVYQVEIVRELHSDRIESIAYYDEHRRLHRSGDEPAIVEYEPASGRPIFIAYSIHGVESRSGGKPSAQMIDPRSGVVFYERWLEDGSPRADGPYSIERDKSTGDIQTIHRYEHGKSIIEQTPFNQSLDANDLAP